MIADNFENVYCIDTLVNGMENFLSCFVVKDEIVVLSDPGPPCVADEVVKSLKSLDVGLDYIAVSHVHVDHAGAVSILVEEFDSKVIAHPKAVKHLVNPEKLWKSSLEALGKVADIYGKPDPIDASKVIPVDNGERFELGEETMRIVYTPGHAVHHISFYLEGSGVLLSGESIGMYLKDRLILTSPIPPLRKEDVMKTFSVIEELNPVVFAYCHFGFSKPTIEKVRNKTERWIEIARGVHEKGGGIGELNEKLMMEDEEYRYLCEYYKDNLVFSYPYRTVLNGLLFAVSE
jgi:glyoxylase-like metal-dependent hydrolase (beta-lactamase superfamily II)